MNIKNLFENPKIESIKVALSYEAKMNLIIPSDYKDFRATIGGIYFKSEHSRLVLDPEGSGYEIAEFSRFYDYKSVYEHQMDLKNDLQDYVNKKEIENKIMRVACCEEQVRIYIGYGEKNLNKVYIYILEEDILKEIGSLADFVNDYLRQSDNE